MVVGALISRRNVVTLISRRNVVTLMARRNVVTLMARRNPAKLNLLPKEPIESLWDGLWLGILPILCFDGRMSEHRVGLHTGGSN